MTFERERFIDLVSTRYRIDPLVTLKYEKSPYVLYRKMFAIYVDVYPKSIKIEVVNTFWPDRESRRRWQVPLIADYDPKRDILNVIKEIKELRFNHVNVLHHGKTYDDYIDIKSCLLSGTLESPTRGNMIVKMTFEQFAEVISEMYNGGDL